MTIKQAYPLTMAKGKKCPSCAQWTMHKKKDGYWYCSNCNATTFG